MRVLGDTVIGIMVLVTLTMVGCLLFGVYFNAGLLGLVVLATILAVAYVIGRSISSRLV